MFLSWDEISRFTDVDISVLIFGNIPGFYYVLKQTKPTTTVSSLYGERSTFLRNVEGGGGGTYFEVGRFV